ncbi:MAG: hypothetical protein J6T00_02885 [Bacteroidaceae bacterium]|nr:hypothetical protein [Bacteroidaceae bacterium]
MKKKVLFALIALFSCLTTWAADVVKVGGYDVTLTSKLVTLADNGTATAPSATSVAIGTTSGNLFKANESVYKIDDDGKLVTAELNAIGNYFLKVTTTDGKSLFVPFQVGKTGDASFDVEYIWNKATFDASVGDITKEPNAEDNPHGILYYYYKYRYPYSATADDYDHETHKPSWAAIANDEDWRALMFPQINFKVKGLQREGDDFNAWEKYAVYAKYRVKKAATATDAAVDEWRGTYTQLDGGKPALLPTGGYWMISIPELYNDVYPIESTGDVVTGLNIGHGYVLNYNEGETVLPNGEPLVTNSIQDALEADFNWDYVQLFLVPQVDPSVFTISLDYGESVYNGANTRSPRIFDQDGNEITYILQDNDNVKWYGPDGSVINTSSSTVSPFGAVGTYTVVVTRTAENGTYYATSQYVVKPLELTVGAGNLYIGYGDEDPTEPSYGTVYSQLPTGDSMDDINISGLSVVRKTPKVGTEPEAVNTVIPYTIIEDNPTTGNPNYTLKVTPVDGNIIVTKKFLSEPEFTVTVDDEDLVYNGKHQMPSVTVKRGDETLVEGTDYVVELASDQDNVNANVDQNRELIPEKDHIKIIIKANEDGNYTSIVKNDGDETLTPIEKGFDIAQRNINEVAIAEIADVIFNNAAQEPLPAVTYDNGTAEGLTLASGTDFNYGYDNNIYVTDAAVCKIEAVYTQEVVETVLGPKVYTGNWYGEKTANFTINPFVFTLLPQDGEKPYLDDDPIWNDAEWAKAQLVARPSADMKDAAGHDLAFPVDDVSTLLKDGWSISRAVGEFIAVYDINIKNAELKESNPASVSDPAHNYVMTVETGTFEIKKAAEYYASSKFVTREFRSGDNTIPFVDEDNNADGNAFYLYRRTVEDQEVTYVQIPETDDLYLEIKASGRISGNQRVAQNPALQPANSPFAIEPIIDNGDDEVQYEYEIAVLPRNAFQHTTGDYAETPEGIFDLTPRKVTIMADNKTSVFGEDYKDLTYKVYDGHITRDEVTEETEESEVQLVTNGAYAAHTIAYFNGLSCGIEAAVNAAAKPLTANVTADIVVSTAGSQGNQTLAQRNPNYDINFVDGTYTVTPSTNQYFVYVELNKDYDGTTGNWDKNVTWTFGTSKETAEPIDGDNPVTAEEIGVDWGEAGEPTEVGETTLTSEMITRPDNANVIGGYPVNYDGLATISVAGEVVITVKNLGAQYPVPPTLSFDNKRVSVTGATFDEIAANGDFVLTYTKPEVGFIKKGATVQVEFNGKAFGTPEGQVVSADDWAWVANYTKVTVKSGKVMVTAPEAITLDIVAFQKDNYLENHLRGAEINDELIRDYAGTAVNKVTITCSEQAYTIKGDQWYSMVLPFEATVREIQSLFNGFVGVDQLNQTASASKASEIRFTYTTKNVPANNPFIAKTDNDFTFTGATISRGDDKIMIEYPENEDGTAGDVAIEDANGNKFFGTYNAFFAPNKTEYDFVNLGRGAVQAMNKDAYVRPLGAYFQVAEGVLNNEAPLRIVIEEFDGTETVIEAVEAEGAAEGAEGAEGWYTITGIKLDAEPTTSGTYLFNGKKVFIQK